MERSCSRREFLSLLSFGAASVVAACGGGSSSSTPTEPSDPKTPSTITVEREGEKAVARAGSAGRVLASGTNHGRVIQKALNEVKTGGTVRVLNGTYTIEITEGTGRVTVPSNVTLEGEGPRRTVLKMASGVNMDAVPILGTASETENAVIRDLEVDGNEFNNRDIEPFPDSPHGHGIDFHGTNNTLQNVFVHNTIRSNITLHGNNCALSELELENSATDHWLYFTNAEGCTVDNVHATGFARGDGIVFGVGQNTVRNNVLSNVIIEGATTTPVAAGDPAELQPQDNFPRNAVIFRASENTRDNTVENLTVRDPQHEAGQAVFLGHPGATLRGYDYRGPAGYYEQMIRIGSAARGVPGAEVSNVTLEITEQNSQGASEPAIVASRSRDIVVKNLEIIGAVGASLRGAVFDGEHREVGSNTLENARIESGGPVVSADGTQNPVTDLALVEVTDVRCSGVDAQGEVTFEERDVSCP